MGKPVAAKVDPAVPPGNDNHVIGQVCAFQHFEYNRTGPGFAVIGLDAPTV